MKKLSLILAIILCLSSFNIYAADEPASETVVVTEEAIKADAFIKAIGINAPSTTDFSKKVTRIEFLRTVMSAIKASSGDGASFADVSGEDYALASAAVKLGIISDSSAFNPDREVTAAEGYKMAVVATGYALEAELNGSYPAGYVYAANYAEISSGLDLDADDVLTYADFAVLIRNMCEVNIKQQTGFGDRNSYTITDGKNILTTYHNISIDEGIFEADEWGSLYSRNIKAGEGRAIIDSVEYRYSGESKLGYRVRVYSRGESGIKDVVYMEEIYNKVLKVRAEDIADIQNGKLVYYNGDKTKNANVKPSPAMIYNGVAAEEEAHKNFASISITNGSLTLIDNNENGIYDIVYIDEFYYMFVSKISGKKDALYDVNRTDNTVRFDEDTYLTVSINGAKSDVGAITPNTGAMVYRSENDEKINIELSTKKTNAKIDGIDTTNRIVTASGASYEYSDYFADYYADKVMSIASSSLIIANDGKLIAVDSTENNMILGMIFDAASDTSGLSNEYMLKIYTEDGKLETFSLAKNVSVDALDKEPASDVMTNYIDNILSDSDAVKSFIAFALNGDNEITKIDTIYPREYWSDSSVKTADLIINGNEDPNDRLKFYKSLSGENARIKMNNIHNEIALSANTVVFDISLEETLDDEMRGNIGDRSIFPDDKNISGTVYAINVGKTLSPEYILRTTTTSTVGDQASGGVVESVVKSIDPNGDESWKFEVFGDGGNFIRIYSSDNKCSDSGEEIGSGDHIRYTANSLGIASDVKLDYDFSKDAIVGIPDAVYNSTLSYYRGYIYSAIPSDSLFIFTKDTTWKEVPDATDFETKDKEVLFTWYAAVYDAKAKTVTRIKFSDIVGYIDDMDNYDYAVVRQSYAQGKTLVVYRNLEHLR